MLPESNIQPSPRGRVRNWRDVLVEIAEIRKSGYSLEAACVRVGIAYSTYHNWLRRQKEEDGKK